MADQYKSVAELMKNLHEAFANWQWYLWGLSSIITIFLARKNRRTHGFSTEMLIPVVGGILGGFFGLLKVLLYIAANKAEMQGKLDWDGMVAITIGASWGIVTAIKEIRKLLKP
jgi:hypothetical protein